MAFLKNTKVTESVNFQLRFEFFNFFNRANLNTVDTNLPDGNFGQSDESKCAAIPSDRRKYNFLDAYPGQMRSRLIPDFSANTRHLQINVYAAPFS